MKIRNMNPKKVKRVYKNTHKSKYWELYKKIKEMPYGAAIRITLDKPVKFFPPTIYQNLRLKRTGYRISIYKQDQTNRVYALIKRKAK